MPLATKNHRSRVKAHVVETRDVELEISVSIGSVTLPFSLSIQLSMITVLCALLPVIVTGWVELRSGSLIAKYFAAGWTLLILGGVANVLRGFGVLPVNLVTVFGAQIGALATMLLLTFGLMDRFRVLQKQIEVAQKKAILHQQQANRELDEKVQRRTADLEVSHQVISQKNAAFKILLETSAKMDHQRSLQSLLDHTVSQLVRVFPNNQFALLLNDKALEENVQPIFHDVHIQQQQFLMRYHQHLMSSESLSTDNSDNQNDSSLFDDLNVVPIRQGKELLVGHIIMTGTALTQADKELLMVFVEQLSAFLKNKVLHDQLELLANKDALTGTFSRAYFESQLAMLTNLKLTKDEDFTLLLIDVNGLKYVNDVHGHNDGDLMLKIVAEYLMEHVRGNDLVCRLGGDEFVVIITGKKESAHFVIDKLMARQTEMNLACGEGDNRQIIPVRFSLGSASTSEHACEDLLREADQDMYLSKRKYYEDNPNALTRDTPKQQ